MILTSIEWTAVALILAANAAVGVVWVYAMVRAVRAARSAKLLVLEAAYYFRDMRRQMDALAADAKGGLRLAGLDDTHPPVSVTPTDYL